MSLSNLKYCVSLSPLVHLTPEHLKQAFKMGPHQTGEPAKSLYWAIDNRRAKAGELAGCDTPGGLFVGFHYNRLRVNEVAFTIQKGRFPKGKIIHLDGDETNQAIENLHEIPAKI